MSHAQHLTVTDEGSFSQALTWHCFSNCLPPTPSPSLYHTIVPEASSPLPGLEFVTCALKSQGYFGSSNASVTTQEGRPMGFVAFRPVQSSGENHYWWKKTAVGRSDSFPYSWKEVKRKTERPQISCFITQHSGQTLFEDTQSYGATVNMVHPSAINWWFLCTRMLRIHLLISNI